MSRQLAVAWGQFLSGFSWDWYVTLTFRDWVNSFRAHRLFGYFVRDLERKAKQPIFWFRVDEIGPHGGGFYILALIGNTGPLPRLFYFVHWDKMAGYARIVLFSS